MDRFHCEEVDAVLNQMKNPLHGALLLLLLSELL
jgi:hypothetical protein